MASASAVKQLVFAGLIFGMDQVQTAMARVPFVETWDETVNEVPKNDDFGDFGDFGDFAADGADDGFGDFGDANEAQNSEQAEGTGEQQN